MNTEHQGQIYIAKAPCHFAGRQCYPGAAIRSDLSPGDAWELHNTEKHGAEPLVLDACQACQGTCQA